MRNLIICCPLSYLLTAWLSIRVNKWRLLHCICSAVPDFKVTVTVFVVCSEQLYGISLAEWKVVPGILGKCNMSLGLKFEHGFSGSWPRRWKFIVRDASQRRSGRLSEENMAQPADSGTSRNLLKTEHQLPSSSTVISTYIDCAVRTCYVESSRGNSMSAYARLCLVAVVRVRSSVSRFLPRPVSVPHVSHDALFLHLQFFRRVLFLYPAFPAIFGPCISRFSCSVRVSRASLFSLFPVMVITLFPQSARSQLISIARPPAVVCVMFRFKLGVCVACSWGKAPRPVEAKLINISYVPWPRVAGRSHFGRIRSAFERLGTQHTKRRMNKCNAIVITCVHFVYYHVQWN